MFEIGKSLTFYRKLLQKLFAELIALNHLHGNTHHKLAIRAFGLKHVGHAARANFAQYPVVGNAQAFLGPVAFFREVRVGVWLGVTYAFE